MTRQTENNSITMMHFVVYEIITRNKSMEALTVLFINDIILHHTLILYSINVARKAFLESLPCLCNFI